MYAFQYHRQQSLADAAKLLTGEAKLLAGGHTLIPTMKQRLANPPALIDLGRINRRRILVDFRQRFEVRPHTRQRH